MKKIFRKWCCIFCCVILCLSNTTIAFAENDESINQTDSISNAVNENETSVNDESQVNKEEGENEEEKISNLEEKDVTDSAASEAETSEKQVETNVKNVSVKYTSHMQSVGWKNEVQNGATSGLPGQGKRMEALKVNLGGEEDNLSVEYKSHVSSIGWQSWKKDGEISGTTGQGKAIEAVQLKLSGANSANHYICYRVYAAGLGWLGWARDGEIAGTTGMKCSVEAIEVRVMNKDDALPGSSENHYIPALWEINTQQIQKSTNVAISAESIEKIVEENRATSLEITANMNYNGKAVRTVKVEKTVKDILENGFVMDFKDYGRFSVNAKFKKNGNVVNSSNITVDITADEYNLAPISATSPVTLFSLSLWDITNGANGNKIPTIVMLTRPSAYDWNSLPEGVYGTPYLTNVQKWDLNIYADYVKMLYKISPNAKFNMYLNDIDVDIIHQIIYANKIPENQYTLTLLSDGSATYNLFNEEYKGTNPQSTHNNLVKDWNSAKDYAYKNGKAKDGWSRHKHMSSFYAVVTSEANVQWWVIRTNLFKSGDNNVFADKAAQKATRKNVSSMLTDLQNKGNETVEEFKNLYNFNDEYFKEAENQGKKAMMILGTYVNLEKSFEDYTNLTKLYYGDDYVYYYKGHPNTPTGMWPEKQKQLDELEVIDVDSSIAAELILFFNPEISLSGYGTSTFNSASADMACGLYNTTKKSALSGASGVDYSGIDWFASAIDTNSKYAALCAKGTTCYLVEFSDEILKQADYEFAIYNANSDLLTYYKNVNGKYIVVKKQGGEKKLTYSAHVAKDGWQASVTEGGKAGTTGQAKAVEAMKVKLNTDEYSGSIEYRAHVAKKGWQNWKKDGQIAGTTGEALAMEAVQLKLTGEIAEHYDIYYRVHSQTYGWLGWAKNGEIAGTTDYGKRIEAFEIRLVEKGGKAPGTTEKHYVYPQGVFYQSHVQTYGWQNWQENGATSGTSGKAKRLEAIKIKLKNINVSGNIEYQSHVQTYGWEKNWKKNGELSGTSGKAKRLEAVKIRLTGDLKNKYDIYYRVHSQTYGWLGWAKNGEAAGTEGFAKRLEAIQIVLVEKGGKALGNTEKAFVKE